MPGIFTAINRAYNSDSTRILGDVSIKGAVSGNTFGYVEALEKQTTQAIYTVPLGKYAAIMNVSSAMNNSTNQDASAIFKFITQLNGGVFRTQIRYGLQKRGTSNISSDLILPALYPPLTRIKLAMEPDTTAMDVSGEFSVQLIDESLVNL